MLAFLSYQTGDRYVAGEIGSFLDKIGVRRFMAHESINVSRKWQEEILCNLDKADLFIAILSARYLESPYCLQESGIAVFAGKPIIPLAIDRTTPPGFMAHIQSRNIQPKALDGQMLLASIAEFDRPTLIDCLIERFNESGSYAEAAENFERLEPYLKNADDL